MNVKLYFSLFALFFIFSCEEFYYEPSGEENFHNIEEPANNVSIDFLNPVDTIGVWGSTRIYLKYMTDNKPLDNITVYIDTINLSVNLADSSFYINSTQFTDGIYNLKILLSVKSESGSLGDEIGYDLLSDTLIIPLIIDNAPPTPVQITSIQRLNGKLQINFQKYKRFNFQEYQISRYEYNYLATISNRNTNYWRDPNYLGGDIGYSIRIKAKDQYVRGDIKYFSEDFASINVIENINNERINITWEKCKYDSAFSSYVIERRLGSHYSTDWHEIKNSTSVNDTLFSDRDFYFGTSIYYRLTTNGLNGNRHISDDTSSHYGTKISGFERIKYIPANNLIYSIPYGILYDANTMQIVNSLDNFEYSSFSIDDLGNRAFCRVMKPGAGNDKYIREINPITLDSINTFYTPNIVGYQSIVGRIFSARNGLIFYEGYTYSSPTIYGDATFLINVDSGQQIARIHGNYFWTPRIRRSHPLGQYILMKDDEYYLYKIENNQFNIIEQFTSGNHFTYYETDKYITTNNASINIRDLSTLSTINSFNIQYDLYNPSIDPLNGYIGGYVPSDSTYKIYNLNNGSLEHEANIIFFNSSDMDTYWQGNKILFSQSGYYHKMNY